MDHFNLQQKLPLTPAQRCWKWTECPINDDRHSKQRNFSGMRFSRSMVTLLFSILMLIGWTGTAFSQVAKNYQHWADAGAGNWNGDILNDSKSDYFEGQVIPHVHVIQGTNKKPLVTGQSYSFTIVYNFYQLTKNAGGFAYVTTYNPSRNPGLLPGGSGLTPILDNTATPGLNIGGSQGYFYTINADVTDASAPVKSGSGTFDNTITVTFIYTGTNPQGLVEFYYGLYIAEPGQVPDQGKGATDGASSWSGGSLQTTVSSAFSGALSLQLAPGAIIRGEISGLKYFDKNNNRTQDSGEGPLANFTFYLDINNNGVLDAGERTDVTGDDGVFFFSVTPDAIPTTTTVNDPYYVRELQDPATGYTMTQPSAGFYGPILITALDPNERGLLFGNFKCISPEASIGSPTNLNCFGGATGAATASATGGTAGYSYSWNTSPVQTTATASGLIAGTYIVTVTDANGCTDTEQVTITQPAAALVASIGSPTNVNCFGAATGSATASATGGTAVYSYSWNTSPVQTTATASSLIAGTYIVTVTDANGCSDTEQVTITGPAAVLTANANADVLCVDGLLAVSLTITPSGGTGPYIITQVATDIEGTYSYTVTDANGCDCEVGSTLKKDSTSKSTLSSPAAINSTLSTVTISSTAPLKQEVLAKKASSDLDKLAITVFPNPFTEEVNFIFKSPAPGYAQLEIFDIMGKRMGVAFKGNVEANTPQTARFNVPAYSVKNMLVYRLTVGGQAVSGKVLPQ